MAKERYRVVRLGNRGDGYYCKDTLTGARPSLETRDRKEAERLVRHKNEALKNPHINRKIGMAYLSACDPSLVTRTWDDVQQDILRDKTGPNLRRWDIANRDVAFDLIRKKVVVATLPEDFVAVLRAGTVSTNVYLRRIQNHALDMGWLPVPVLPKKKFPKFKPARLIRPLSPICPMNQSFLAFEQTTVDAERAAANAQREADLAAADARLQAKLAAQAQRAIRKRQEELEKNSRRWKREEAYRKKNDTLTAQCGINWYSRRRGAIRLLGTCAIPKPRRPAP